NFGPDAEELGYEIFEVRRERKKQLRFRLAAKRFRGGPSRRHPRAQGRIPGVEMLTEQVIQAAETSRSVEVGQAQAVGKRKTRHCSRRGGCSDRLWCIAKGLKPYIGPGQGGNAAAASPVGGGRDGQEGGAMSGSASGGRAGWLFPQSSLDTAGRSSSQPV